MHTEAITATLVAALVVGGAPLVAVLLVSGFTPERERWLTRLVPLAAGMMAGAALFHLIPEAMGEGLSVATCAIGIVAGVTVFALVDRALHPAARVVPAGPGDRATGFLALNIVG